MTLIVAALIVSTAAAQEMEQNSGYIVTPAGDTDKIRRDFAPQYNILYDYPGRD